MPVMQPRGPFDDLVHRGPAGKATPLPTAQPSSGRDSIAALGNVVWGGEGMAPMGNAAAAGVLGGAALIPAALEMSEPYWAPPAWRGVEAMRGYGSRALEALRGATADGNTRRRMP